MHAQWDLYLDSAPWGIPICKPRNAIAVPVGVKPWRPRFSEAGNFQPNKLLGNDYLFFILGILGRLQTVQIHSSFASKEDSRVAAVSTGHHTEIGREMWRRVTIHAKPDTIRGRTSTEHPDFQTDEPRGLNGEIYALFLTQTIGKGGYKLGIIFGDEILAYRVL